MKAQGRVELVREMAPARSSRSPGPCLAVGTLLLWEVTERSELPSGPGRRALAGLSAVGTQDPEGMKLGDNVFT